MEMEGEMGRQSGTNIQGSTYSESDLVSDAGHFYGDTSATSGTFTSDTSTSGTSTSDTSTSDTSTSDTSTSYSFMLMSM